MPNVQQEHSCNCCHMQPCCADSPVLHVQLYKDNPMPAWWPLPTFDAKELKTRAAMNTVYGALQSRFGEMPVRLLLIKLVHIKDLQSGFLSVVTHIRGDIAGVKATYCGCWWSLGWQIISCGVSSGFVFIACYRVLA